ncbi:unnamed protein product [Rotaria sp. Silwood1]|nr:unnamed protein product [Rotaria sp. Silwood1]CAF3709591.1 unnamed protein product [Rotaria sp. Silwood1]CAF4773699.1 unnamed protein product [Rotaria sp. Silwood1]
MLKYAFIGNPATKCPGSCGARTPSPNNNSGLDAMFNTMAHELSEAATDPQINAWLDAAGAENADKCVWTFGTTFSTLNGATANVICGGNNYYIQQNWKLQPLPQGCGLS